MNVTLTVLADEAKEDGFMMVCLGLNDISEKEQRDLNNKINDGIFAGNIDSMYIVRDTSSRVIKLKAKNDLSLQALEALLQIHFSSAYLNCERNKIEDKNTLLCSFRPIQEKRASMPANKL